MLHISRTGPSFPKSTQISSDTGQEPLRKHCTSVDFRYLFREQSNNLYFLKAREAAGPIMPKGRGRGAPRKSRNAASFASDVEMKDADPPRNERPKSKAKNSSTKPKNESDRRGRVGKQSPPPQGGGVRGSKKRGGADVPDGWRLKTNMTMLASRASNKNHRLSIISAASTTLSAQQAGPWCDKCTRLNRQLHGYLLEILKNGEDAIGEWAYAVGASPDHMDYEPAPERIIPEGYRRCSRQHQLCAGEAGTNMAPPLSGWTGTSIPGVYPGHVGNALGQASAGISPFSQSGPGLELSQRMQEPIPTPTGSAIQPRQNLVAIPEHAEPCAERAGPPSQAQLPVPQPLQPPWNGGFQRPVAMYPSSGPAQNATFHWANQQRHVPTGPSEYGIQQHVGTMPNPPGSLASNEAMRAVAQGRVLREKQDLSDSDIPE